MSILITVVIGSGALFFSRIIFKSWFNHLALYTVSWSLVIILYEIKLMRYIDLSSEAWITISYSFFTFFLGVITIFLARDSLGKDNSVLKNRRDIPYLVADNGKLLKYLILFFSLLGLLNAFQHWYILIREFGDLQTVLIRAGLVYKLRTEGEIKGVIPYVYISSYIAVVLAGIYTAYKNKLTLIAILPFLAIIIKEIASVGRAGILIGFLEFIISFFLFRQLIRTTTEKTLHFLKKKNIIIAITIITILFAFSATVVKSLRGPVESFKGTTTALNRVKGGEVISPSIYLYASAHIGVLSKYLENPDEKVMFGENTFQPVYNLISKFGIIKHPNFFQKGYLIPMWTNTGTYLREIHADFGYVGLFIFPYLLGFVTTLFWFRSFERGKMLDFIILIYLYLIIGLSFLVMITRTSVWFISFFCLLIIVPLTEKYIKRKYC